MSCSDRLPLMRSLPVTLVTAVSVVSVAVEPLVLITLIPLNRERDTSYSITVIHTMKERHDHLTSIWVVCVGSHLTVVVSVWVRVVVVDMILPSAILLGINIGVRMTVLITRVHE